MKIALLSEKYTPDIGGLAISTERLARLLYSAGHDTRVFCPSRNLPPSKQQTRPSNGVSVTRLGAHKRMDDTLADWFELIVAEHQRDPFDVLHAYFLTQAGFVATYTGRYLDVPSVVSIRGNDIERAAFDPAKFSHAMYALQNASAVTTNTNELAGKAKAFVDREIHLIPNGVDTRHFKPMERNLTLTGALGITGEVIGFVGELREKKGIKTLLPAYATVNKKQLSTLLIVGTIRPGEDKQFFDEFLTSNPNLGIYVTGYISPDDLPVYYSMIDVLVHPSLRDGMPNAVLEAMACERAVIATPVGGVKEVIRDGDNGSIVPANDAKALSIRIIKLLEDRALRSRLGQSARETVRQNHTLQSELAGNLTVYKKLGLE